MTPLQCRVARALLEWTAERLAEQTRGKVSLRTLFDFEGGKRKPQAATVEALEQALARAGITFDPDGVNVRLAVKTSRAKRRGD